MSTASNSPEPRIRIRCRLDGPLIVEGAVEVLDHRGNAFTLPGNKPQVALCRCGHSQTRPFCDGSHRRQGFVATELAQPEPPEQQLPPADG